MQRVNLFSMDPSEWTHGQMRRGFRWRSSQLGKLLGATRLGGSLYDLGDGERTFPYHFHHGMEEWLLVIEGTPTLRAQGYERELKAGDVVCFPTGPEGAHQVRGPGTVLLLSANRSPEVTEYTDSGKIGVRPPGKVLRADSDVDYWDGEEIAEEVVE